MAVVGFGIAKDIKKTAKKRFWCFLEN